MKLTLDANARVNLVRSYSDAQIRVGDQVFAGSCIITPDTVIGGWRPIDVNDLQEADLEPLFAARPELVLLGTGSRHRFAPAAIRGLFARRSIALETMDLGAACRTFNILVQEERRVCAALMLEGSGSVSRS